MSSQSYFEEEKQKYTIRLRESLDELPSFMQEFFRSLAQTTSIKTRLGYSYDLKIFFNYLMDSNINFESKEITELKISDLNLIESEDIDIFMEYLTYYTKPDEKKPSITLEFKNDEKGKARKLAAIRSMFKYFYKKKKIISNPAAIVDSPKIHDKAIVRLDVNEVVDLLNEVENGAGLTQRQKLFHEYTKLRDLALVSLLIGTGMRVSECVGINIGDIDFNTNGIKITRKGGNQVVIYFGDEVSESLIDYIENERSKTVILPEYDHALFISRQGRRISVRTVQNLVKKYSKVSVKLKNISPHKLRSTYGTNLYRETGDIYLVADVLGHADVNTTKKHYAQIEEDRRRSAAKYIKLRKD